MSEIKLVVALGNPGAEYEFTRHNIGQILLRFFGPLDGQSWRSKFKAHLATARVSGSSIPFIQPQTYMNLSGESARPACDFYNVSPKEVLVLHDELDLPFGALTFKRGGGLAGHNGLKSLNQHLGSPDFVRMRIGIGRPPRGSVSSWVLGQFGKEEEAFLGDFMERGAKALECALESGIKKAMDQFNTKTGVL